MQKLFRKRLWDKTVMTFALCSLCILAACISASSQRELGASTTERWLWSKVDSISQLLPLPARVASARLNSLFSPDDSLRLSGNGDVIQMSTPQANFEYLNFDPDSVSKIVVSAPFTQAFSMTPNRFRNALAADYQLVRPGLAEKKLDYYALQGRLKRKNGASVYLLLEAGPNEPLHPDSICLVQRIIISSKPLPILRTYELNEFFKKGT